MNKKDLVGLIASDTRMPKQVVDRIFDSFIRRLRSELVRGEKIKIAGFGTLQLFRTARTFYCHPTTGEKIPACAKIRARFIPSSLLKKRIED